MQKVLITGASGFIGKALTKKLLNDGIEVYAIVRNTDKLSDLVTYPNLKIIMCGMSEYHTLSSEILERDFDTCFHFAWDGVSLTTQDIPTQLSNIKTSTDLLNFLISVNIKRVLFIRSSNEFKFVKNNYEQVPLTYNYDIYGIAKTAVYKIFEKILIQNNIEFYPILYSNVFGVGDYSRRSTNIIIDKFLKGESPNLADGSILYDWVYIDDAIQAIIAVLEKGIPYKTYYLGHRKLQTFKDIITNVRDVVNPNVSLSFGTFHDTSFIDYDRFFNDDLYCDTGFEITSDFKEKIKKTTEWVKNLGF